MQSQDSSKKFFENINPFPGFESFSDIFERILTLSNEVNKSFTQGRLRIKELTTTVADVAPNVIRVGGTIEDVQKTMSAIAEASRRNIVGTDESIVKLSAASKVLGLTTTELVSNFNKVGVSTSLIGKQLENSIEYISSLGLNSKQVVKTISDNLELLNRYQFENGVQGLTKMAAQASMLKFDMTMTTKLADLLYKPEKAIEVASAFQRLGLAVGSLGDPFQLMNQSINDPSGLQDSLIEMTKQFSYFDEKTKQFKISPEGVLRLKELGSELSISSDELTKLSISAQDLDRRLSKVNVSPLKFENEQDKLLFTNLLEMDKEGEYKIKLYDELTGKADFKNINEISQVTLNKLLEEQKKGPKTLEEISRSQLKFSEILASDVGAIKQAIVGGFVTVPGATREIEGLRNVLDKFGGKISEKSTTDLFRKEFKEIGNQIIDLAKVVANPNSTSADRAQAYASFKEFAESKIKTMQEGFDKNQKDFIRESTKLLSDKSELEKLLKKLANVESESQTDQANTNMGNSSALTILGNSIQDLVNGSMVNANSQRPLNLNPTSLVGTNDQNLQNPYRSGFVNPSNLAPLVPYQTMASVKSPKREFDIQTLKTTSIETTNTLAKTSTDINVSGTIKHELKLESPAYVSRDDLSRALSQTFESSNFKNSIVGLVQKMNVDPARSNSAV